MTRRPAIAAGHSALYESMREAFEAEARQLLHRPGVDAHLAAMQTGAPIHVHVADLPAWARDGQPLHYWRRAIVTLTGSVEFYDGDALQWADEHGL